MEECDMMAHNEEVFNISVHVNLIREYPIKVFSNFSNHCLNSGDDVFQWSVADHANFQEIGEVCFAF